MVSELQAYWLANEWFESESLHPVFPVVAWDVPPINLPSNSLSLQQTSLRVKTRSWLFSQSRELQIWCLDFEPWQNGCHLCQFCGRLFLLFTEFTRNVGKMIATAHHRVGIVSCNNSLLYRTLESPTNPEASITQWTIITKRPVWSLIRRYRALNF